MATLLLDRILYRSMVTLDVITTGENLSQWQRPLRLASAEISPGNK